MHDATGRIKAQRIAGQRSVLQGIHLRFYLLGYQVKHRSGSQWATSIESDRAGVFDPTDGSEGVLAHSVGNLSRYRPVYQT